MDWITDRIAIGNWEDATRELSLQDPTVDAILNVALELDLNYGGPTTGMSIPYYKIGLKDGPGNSYMLIDACVQVLSTLVAQNNRVLVCCYMGLSRSPVVVVKYLSTERYLTNEETRTWEEAYRHVQSKRDIHPHPALLLHTATRSKRKYNRGGLDVSVY